MLGLIIQFIGVVYTFFIHFRALKWNVSFRSHRELHYDYIDSRLVIKTE